MQKALDLLEKHVQWLVLGLGVLFVLYMVYSYVLTPPAVVTIGGKEQTASTVDQSIIDNVADTLDTKIKSTSPINITVEPFEERFQATINNSEAQVARLNNLLPPIARVDGEQPTPDKQDPNVSPGQVAPGGVTLITLPKAKPLNAGKPGGPGALTKGRSMLQPVNAVAAADGAGMPAPADAFINPGNPAANGGVQPVEMIDRDWTTAFFTISMKELVAAWRAAGIVPPAVPNLAQQSLFLEVIAEREEQTGVDGQGQPVWGNRTTLKPLSTVNLLPVPDAAVPAQGQLVFQQWAEKAQGDILQPPFYPIVSGDAWHEPGVDVAKVGGNAAEGGLFDPNAGGMPPGLINPGDPTRKQTPEEIRAARETERKNKAAEAKAKRDAAKAAKEAGRPGRSGPPGGMPPGMPSYQAFDPNRQPYRPPGYDPRTGMPPGFNPNMRPGGPGMNPNAGGPAVPTAPTGLFVPNPQMGDVTAWVHDDTVKPGKIYRYRIRYAMKNPVYNTNLADKKVVDVFAIRQKEAESSDWTESVSIATRTQFFIAGVQPTKATIRVFRWQGGVLNVSDFSVQPGDPIGGTIDGPNGPIDYSTGSTLVDIRDNGTILVMDDQNIVRQRTFDSDRNDPEHRKLQGEASPPSARGGLPEISAQGGVGMAR